MTKVTQALRVEVISQIAPTAAGDHARETVATADHLRADNHKAAAVAKPTADHSLLKLAKVLKI